MYHSRSKINFKRYISRYIVTLVAVVFSLCVFSSVTQAASLYVSPASVSISAGNITTVRLLVATVGKAINNAEATLQFPADLLEVISVSKTSSIFPLWVEEPKFSNIEGNVTFNGGVPSPGYTGDSGEIVSVTFRAKQSGTASIVVSDAAVRQNDGLGTDILNTKVPGSIVITPAVAQPEVVAEVIPPGAPAAPVVISATHPQSNKWYALTDAELTWAVPSDVTEVSTRLDQIAVSMPTVTQALLINSKKLTDLKDGVWYFHIRFKNKNGWGARTHFKIQIDTVPPNPFKIVFPNGQVSKKVRATVGLNASDGLSGIDHYEAKIDNEKFVRLVADKENPNQHTLPATEPGKHSLLIKAFDLAGNATVQAEDFSVDSIALPVITSYSKEVTLGKSLKVKGNSSPQTRIEVVVEDKSGHSSSQTVPTDTSGGFSVVWSEKLSLGNYTLKARSIDAQDAMSDFTDPYDFVVKESSFSNIQGFVLNWLSLIIIIILAGGSAVLLIWNFVYRGIKIKKSIDRKVESAENSVHKAFSTLRKDVRKQIDALEKVGAKRELTKEEKKIIENLEKNIAESEEYVEKKIEEIKK